MIFEQSYQDLLQRLQAIDDIGVDCRLDPQCKQLYREAKDARADARQIERKFYLNEGEDTSYNYWMIVAQHSLELLRNYTRDAEVMSWLVEALSRLDSYQGCAFALKVVSLFVEKFAKQCYPHLEEDDEEEWQWMSLSGLNGGDSPGSLIAPLNRIVICAEPLIYLWQYQALSSSVDSEANEQLEQEFSLADILEHIRNQGSECLLQMLQSCEDCMHSLEQLDRILWQQLADLAPGTQRIKQSLEKAHLSLQGLIKQVFGEEVLQQNQTIEVVAEADSDNQSSSKQNHASSKMSRSMAIAMIDEVALYFKSVEPHSPIPYMLQRVIAWSKLSWPELMQTMISQSDAIDHIVQQTGMPITED